MGGTDVDMEHMTDETTAKAWVQEVAADAVVLQAACAEGTLPIRRWPRTSAMPSTSDGAEVPVLLIHGGAGSWTHWIRNIGPLSRVRDVIVPDLPGLGDAATLPKGYTPMDAAAPLIDAIGTLGLASNGLHVVGFSWGATVASLVAAELDEVSNALRSLCLVGPGALGDIPLGEGMKPILGRDPEMTASEIRDLNRENLYRLMFADPSSADELAVYLQGINTARSRFNSPRFAKTEIVKDSLARIRSPVTVVYGDRDAPAMRHLDLRRSIVRAACPQAVFEIMPGGHWLQYESAEQFNPWLATWLASNDGQ
ncbi:MAG: alpha/beta hydrolase [Pseudomonadota bacterium]